MTFAHIFPAALLTFRLIWWLLDRNSRTESYNSPHYHDIHCVHEVINGR